MTSLRRSPPTQRVTAVLDHFAARPERRVGLSELSRTLELSKPTCLGILTTLVERDYLDWDEAEKTYGVGSALLHLAARSRGRTPASRIAEHHLAELSDRYHTPCTASAVVGDHIVILASTDVRGRRPLVSTGQRYRFAPPMGLMHVAWRDEVAFDAWLRRPPAQPALALPGGDPARSRVARIDAAELRAVAAEARHRGFLVEALTPAGRQLHTLVTGVGGYDLPDEVRELVGDMVANLGERAYLRADAAARAKHEVGVIAAPVYGRHGDAELVLSLYVGSALSGAEIARRGAVLAATAAAVTAESGGREPESTHTRRRE